MASFSSRPCILFRIALPPYPSSFLPLQATPRSPNSSPFSSAAVLTISHVPSPCENGEHRTRHSMAQNAVDSTSIASRYTDTYQGIVYCTNRNPIRTDSFGLSFPIPASVCPWVPQEPSAPPPPHPRLLSPPPNSLWIAFGSIYFRLSTRISTSLPRAISAPLECTH